MPGDGDSYGPLYMFSSVFTGVVGALCWPMSFVRIYTANNVKSVKKSTNYAMLIAGGFYALLTVVMLSAAHITGVAANPQAGWTTLLENYGGVWLPGLGLTMIFAGSIGHIDGSVQAAGTQIANDIVGSKIELFDVARGGKRSTVTVGAAVPGMASVAEGESTACEAATSVATCEDAAAGELTKPEDLANGVRVLERVARTAVANGGFLTEGK